MNFDLVIFDCDGVLIDSELLSVEADLACLAEYGIDLTAEEIIERYTGISLAAMLADVEQRRGKKLPGFAGRHRRHLRRLFKAGLRPIPDVVAVLDGLDSRGCPACVASSGTPERIEHALSLVGLYERFQPNLFSTVAVARGKPAPDLFLYAAAQMGAMPQHCVVIEDSIPGVSAAVAAGMTAIGCTGGSHCRPELSARLTAQGAVRVTHTMSALLPILLDLPGRAAATPSR